MDESTNSGHQPALGWTEAEIRTLLQEHGILLRTLARLQEQVGRLLRDAAAQGTHAVSAAGSPDYQ